MALKRVKKIKDIIDEEHSLRKPNGKFFNFISLKFDNDFMYLNADGSIYKIKLKGYSDKLYKANQKDRMNYRISPDGYGISWEKLNEDLSIKSLIRDGAALSVKDSGKRSIKPRLVKA